MRSGQVSFNDVARKYRNLLLLSLVISFVSIPIIDSVVIERDRNRNMFYGEIFLTEGFDVISKTDRELNATYDIPSDHLLTEVLNVSYEYPIITLLFYAGLAWLEPGWFGPHLIANVAVTLLFHLNIILILYIGQDYWNRKWFWFTGGFYYFFGFCMSVGFGKADALADVFWLVSLIYFKRKQFWHSNAVLGIAFHAKVYPFMVFPLMLLSSPMATMGFFAVTGVLYLPLLLAGNGYAALLSHIINDASYATQVPNPFYIGWVGQNPLSIIAPMLLVASYLYGLIEIRWIRGIPLPSTNIRHRSLATFFVFALPLFLMFLSWVLMWYYYWMIIPCFYLKDESDMSRYRIMLVGLLVAHFVGVILNFDALASGPIKEFFGHLK